jgi:curved DNA-binding protein CbpA
MKENWEIHWKDYFSILQIHPLAEPEVVAKAYKALAEKYHPDRNPDITSQRMKDINEAFEIISNIEKRRRYYIAYCQRTNSRDIFTPPSATQPDRKEKHQQKEHHRSHKRKMRKRGTLLVHLKSKVLLVMDRGHHKWSLPGGGVKRGERSFQTAVRELHEELGLNIRKLYWLGHFYGSTSLHSIYYSNQVKGKIHLQTKELKKYMWWDRKNQIDAYGHVWKALEMAKEKKYL